MLTFLAAPDVFPHVLAVLVLLSRLGDIISTRLISPTLRLEANPLARRLGWRFAWVTLIVALVPYYSTALGVMILSASCLVSASNLSRGWIVRAVGEAEYEALILRAAQLSRRTAALGFVLAAAGFVLIAGLTLMWFSGSPVVWGFWFGLGIVVYGGAVALHGSLYVVRVFRRVRLLAPAL